MSTIILGFTPTPQARAALGRAIEEASRRNARLVVINASTGDRYTDTAFAGPDDLAEVRTELEAAGVDFDVQQPVRGHDGAEEVLQAAEDLGAELVVIGVRRRSAVGKFLLGSTASTIIMRAPCDVLTVKA